MDDIKNDLLQCFTEHNKPLIVGLTETKDTIIRFATKGESPRVLTIKVIAGKFFFKRGPTCS